MTIDTFVERLRANPFSESFLRGKAETMIEVYQRATTYIEAEEVMKRKIVEERHSLNKYQHHAKEDILR